jgi:hypothetical protein
MFLLFAVAAVAKRRIALTIGRWQIITLGGLETVFFENTFKCMR